MLIATSFFTAIAMFLITAIAVAQEKEVKQVPAKPTSVVSGQEMFVNYCAVCHGRDGKGGGPAAAALKIQPTDLTLLTQRNGGKFPAAHVSAVIRGEANLQAHGNKQMPVWGPIFWKMSGGHESEVALRIANLSKYLASLQTK